MRHLIVIRFTQNMKPNVGLSVALKALYRRGMVVPTPLGVMSIIETDRSVEDIEAVMRANCNDPFQVIESPLSGSTAAGAEISTDERIQQMLQLQRERELTEAEANELARLLSN